MSRRSPGPPAPRGRQQADRHHGEQVIRPAQGMGEALREPGGVAVARMREGGLGGEEQQGGDEAGVTTHDGELPERGGETVLQ